MYRNIHIVNTAVSVLHSTYATSSPTRVSFGRLFCGCNRETVVHYFF